MTGIALTLARRLRCWWIGHRWSPAEESASTLFLQVEQAIRDRRVYGGKLEPSNKLDILRISGTPHGFQVCTRCESVWYTP